MCVIVSPNQCWTNELTKVYVPGSPDRNNDSGWTMCHRNSVLHIGVMRFKKKSSITILEVRDKIYERKKNYHHEAPKLIIGSINILVASLRRSDRNMLVSPPRKTSTGRETFLQPRLPDLQIFHSNRFCRVKIFVRLITVYAKNENFGGWGLEKRLNSRIRVISRLFPYQSLSKCSLGSCDHSVIIMRHEGP